MMDRIVFLVAVLAVRAVSAAAEAQLPAYTNHAGIAISGYPVKLDRRQVTLASAPAAEASRTDSAAKRETLMLSIFPESEQRRIASDYAAATGDIAALRIPQDIRRALEGSEKAIRRSEKRAEKKLCTEEESRAFVEKSRAARKTYLDKAAAGGRLTPAERKLLD